MSATLSDIIRQVRSNVNEPATPTYLGPGSPQPQFYTDTEITDWINSGLRDIARRAEFLWTVDQTIAVPAYVPGNSLTLALLNDVVRINRVEFVPTGQNNQIYRIEPSTRNEMDQIWGTYQANSSSYPRWYVTDGFPGGTSRSAFVMQLYPQPSQSGTLNVFYYRQPSKLLDPVANPAQYAINVDIQGGWEDTVVDYATYKARQKRKDPDWKDDKANYEEKVSQAVDVTRRYQDAAGFISYGTNMLPGWLVGGGEW